METTHAAQTPGTEPRVIGEILNEDDGLLAMLAMSAFEGVKPDDIVKNKSSSAESPEDL